jgi:hypothetical protein
VCAKNFYFGSILALCHPNGSIILIVIICLIILHFLGKMRTRVLLSFLQLKSLRLWEEEVASFDVVIVLWSTRDAILISIRGHSRIG